MKKRWIAMKRILTCLIAIMILLGGIPAGAGTAETAGRTVRIAILSDLHYVTDRLIAQEGREALYKASQTEQRLMAEIDMLLTAALGEAEKENPDALLICGDLTSNGELLGAQALADKLNGAKTMAGFRNTGFYVVNGNHDLNNSYAASFTGGKATQSGRIRPEEFRTVFSGLGYGKNDHWEGGIRSIYTPAGEDLNEIGAHGALSYAADIADGVTLIVLDTATYRVEGEQPDHYYNDAQQTAGYVPEGLLQWAVEQAKAARARNNVVLTMSHHALLPHYSTEEEKASWYMDSFRIPNWEHVANELADAGVTAMLTGHSHSNDIAMHVSPNNNVIYDIETASLAAYPCSWRTIEIRIDGEGAGKAYAFSAVTHEVQGADLQGDTSGWFFRDGNGQEQTFDDFYGRDLQKYMYDRTGFTKPFLAPGIEYMTKNLLYDIFRDENGLEKTIRKALALGEGESIGKQAQELLRKAADELDGLEKEIELMGMKVRLRMKKTGGTELQPEFEAILDTGSYTNTAKITLDLRSIEPAVDNLIAGVQAMSREGDWMTNPYGTAPLISDIINLLNNLISVPLTTPLEEDNPDSTALSIFSRGYQAYAYGDEAGDREKYDREREILRGDKLKELLLQNGWKELLKISDETAGKKKYPALSSLLKQKIAKTSLVQFGDCDGLFTIFKSFLKVNPADKLSDLISICKTAGTGLNPIPDSAAEMITGKIADLHETMTVDENIPQDREWTFRSVLFDGNGGTVSPDHGVTDGEHRLKALPVPEWAGHTFTGWFTEPDGGQEITPETEMTDTGTAYAHWN